jgi:transglutaminase-like putative cysteine protease
MLAGLMTIAATTTNSVAAEPPAVLRAFTSDDPVVIRARELVQSGKFKEAEALLGANASPAATGDRADMLDLIHRIRYEYSLTHDELLNRLKKSIPDATAADVDRWATESKARFRVIDGEKFFFRREPQNIFLFSEDAKQHRHRAGNAPAEPKWQLVDHLKEVVAEAERTGQIEVLPVHHQGTWTLTIPGHTPGIKTNSLVRVWAPFPQEYRQQRDVKLISSSPAAIQVAPIAIEGNPVAGAPQRTVYFEQRVTDPSAPLEFTMVFDYTSFAYYPKLDVAKVQPLPADWNGADLGERLPHIAFTPEIRRDVAAIIGSETNALNKALKIFRWVSANIPWNAEDEYCTIPSFAIKGFTARRGDCGVQNTVFITMCRIAGVPARWQSGYETKPGDRWGMHDWAEIYIAPWGWLPADASYGVKKSEDPRVADFYCGHQDSYRMIVNLDWGRELVPPKPSARSDAADFQRGEVEVDGKNLYLDRWQYRMEMERTPVVSNRPKPAS